MAQQGNLADDSPLRIKTGRGVIILERKSGERWVMPNQTIDDPPSLVFESLPAEIADRRPKQLSEFLDSAVTLAKQQRSPAILVKARPEHHAVLSEYGFAKLSGNRRRRYADAFRQNDRRKGSQAFIFELAH